MALLGKLKDKADVGAMLSGSVKDKAQDLLRNTLGELKTLGDVLAHCGFIVGDVAIVVGLPPKFTITLEQQEAGADMQKLSDQTESMSKVQRSVVKSLQQIYDMNDMLESEGYTIGQVEVELGVIPEVTVHLISTSSRAFATEAEE